ncbi:MAG: class I SAM-dependent methyltransferase [Planctomycetes bacterium]|nr:class I SAM-dependent methyltransferase [Planctomycetota bacterium]
MTTAELQAVRRNGWELSGPEWEQLGAAERQFALLEFAGQKSVDYYVRRLECIGFSGLEHVLDAGCGMGQWAYAMARLNGRVSGVDINDGRLGVARALGHGLGEKAPRFQSARLESLPFEDGTFDGVFCYGVFMFTNMPAVLAEFRRVLRPGGRLYLNANNVGWYAHLIVDRGLRSWNIPLMREATRMVVRGVLGRPSMRVVTLSWLRKQLAQTGFSLQQAGPEGTACLSGGLKTLRPEPAYPRRFYGLPAITEVVAVKEPCR